MYEFDITINEDKTLCLTKKMEINVSECQMDIEDIMYMFRDVFNMDVLDSENIYITSMDENDYVSGVYHVSKGDYCKCNVYNRTIAAFILLTRGTHFLMVHNHPGNVFEASTADKANAGLLRAMANLIGSEFDGSYIITKDGYRNVDDDEIVLWNGMEG